MIGEAFVELEQSMNQSGTKSSPEPTFSTRPLILDSL
jgi:hypothetical protein